MLMNMKNAIIVGATSGIGLEVARIMRSEGVNIGVAGRREDRLRKFAEEGGNVVWQRIDVTDENAGELLIDLAERMGGVDTILLVSGIGSQNRDLDPSIEIATAETNVVGFTRMIDAAFNYLKSHGGGHIGAVSSIAGTKGLGIAPAYSATKRFQNTYITVGNDSRQHHVHRHPSGICRHRPAEVGQLPDAYAPGKDRTDDCRRLAPQKTRGDNRLAIPLARGGMENDSRLHLGKSEYSNKTIE